MNDAIRSDIERIAQKARKWAEALAEREDICDKESLDGLCARASAKLFLLLKPHHPVRLALVGCHMGSHVFVMCYNYIVDITATQFDSNCVPIEIFHPSLVEEDEWYWQKPIYYHKVKDVMRLQQKKQWPKHQTIQLKDLTDKERHNAFVRSK